MTEQQPARLMITTTWRENPAAPARAMSPNVGSTVGILNNVETMCQVCINGVREPVVCAGCGIYGHPQCLHTEHFFDYPICAKCIGKVTGEYASFQDAQRRAA